MGRNVHAGFVARCSLKTIPILTGLALLLIPLSVQAQGSDLLKRGRGALETITKSAPALPGATLLDRGLIGAGRAWSFWHRVGRPDGANGFQPGRNIVGGKLVALNGGGLCQLASMVYHLALLGGLTVLERHPHSLDIYEEDQRFTPLGADATVVWGFKDLLLHNPHPFPVGFGFRVEPNRLIGELRSGADLKACDIEFERVNLESPWVRVNTMVNRRLLVSTLYEQRQGLQVSPSGRTADTPGPS